VVQYFQPERSLNVFTWPMLLDVDYLKNFEKETGIKLHISYFENNEELYSKLQTSQGAGYDLVIPSDYVIPALIHDNLLKKIDQRKVPVLNEINPKLLDLYFDRKNEYSIPYFWAFYGLGIDKRYFNGVLPEPSWSLIFDKAIAPKGIGMVDVPREAVLIATEYLYGDPEIEMTAERVASVKQLLLTQKKWVDAYTETGIEHLLLSQSSPVVVAMGPDILRIKRNHPYIDFFIPKEGSFMVIDSFAIPVKSTKDDLVYEFINYLFRPEVLEHHAQKYGLCSPMKNLRVPHESEIYPTDEQFAKLRFFKTIMPEKQLNQLWIELMNH
jgi:spermidine/putrescine transport system substrate-binding protein